MPLTSSGTVLVLVVALLAVIAMLATTLLVTSRYDLIGTRSWRIQAQIEMAFPMLEGYIRGTLTNDMWGHGDGWIAGDHEIERYDARDDKHTWLKGVAGRLVKWEREPGDDRDLVQGVVTDGSGWIEMPGTLDEGARIRYAFLITDLNGLLNLNAHRHNDTQFSNPQRTSWAYNATRRAVYDGKTKEAKYDNVPHPEWGYFWHDLKPRSDPRFYWPIEYVGMNQKRRGGGPTTLVTLDSFLRGDDSVEKIDARLSADSRWGRSFDIQTELDLRFPSSDPHGSANVSLADLFLPDTMGHSLRLRRFLTAIGQTANFWPRYEPPPMRPYFRGDPRIVDANGDGKDDYGDQLGLGWRYNVELADWYWETTYQHPIVVCPGIQEFPLRSEPHLSGGKMRYKLGHNLAERLWPACWNNTYNDNTHRAWYLMGTKIQGVVVGPQRYSYRKAGGSQQHTGQTRVIPRRLPAAFISRSIMPYQFASAMAASAILGDGHVAIPFTDSMRSAMMDRYRQPASRFVMNLLDQIDPGDDPMTNIYTSGTVAAWSAGAGEQGNRVSDFVADFDHGVMGVEIQPFLNEVVLAFDADGTLEKVAVELYNPNRRPILMRVPTNRGFVFALRVRRDVDSAIPFFPRLNGDPTLDQIPAGGFMLVYSGEKSELGTLPAGVSVFDLAASNTASASPCQSQWRTSELIRLTAGDELLLLRSCWFLDRSESYHQDRFQPSGQSYWRWFVLDAIKKSYTYTAALPEPAQGIEDAFLAAEAARVPVPGAPSQPVAVRLSRPHGRAGRSSIHVETFTGADRWQNAIANLGLKSAPLGDVQTTHRSFIPASMGAAMRTRGDLARVCRSIHPREDDYRNAADDDEGKAKTITQRVEDACHDAFKELQDEGLAGRPITDAAVARIFQKHEARLYWSPWTAAGDDERRACRRLHDFLECMTAAGAGWDGADNNMDGHPDEHRGSSYNAGYGTGYGAWSQSLLVSWLPPFFFEASNAFPIAGKINVNTAPKEVLMCLNVPSGVNAGGESLREALAETIIRNRPHKSIADLMYNTRTRAGHVGFDYFGFDGVDNHNAGGGHSFPKSNPDGFACDGDRWADPFGLVDDLDERNYLWRLNSEILTTRSDMFAVYLRVQLRQNTRVLAERRVFSIWDRTVCRFAPLRQNGDSNFDFIPPTRLGIQIFGF